MVFGLFLFDLVIFGEVVVYKCYSGFIMGDVDILVVLIIDVGNCLYKLLILFGYVKVGGMIVGIKVLVVLIFRSDLIESKFYLLRFVMR